MPKGRTQCYVNIGVGVWDLCLHLFLRQIFNKCVLWGYEDEQDKELSLLGEPDTHINN